MKNYIVNKNIGVDEHTGMSIELRVKLLTIDPVEKKIIAKVDKCLVSPTGVEFTIIETKYLERYNSELSPKYTMLDLSPIGQGIKQMLLSELINYPDIEQL